MVARRILFPFTLATLVVGSMAILGWRAAVDDGVDMKAIKTMLDEMPYKVKQTDTTEGSEQYETTLTSNSVDIPIRINMSASKTNLWMTVYLGELKKDKAVDLLTENARIQPTMFYVTKREDHLRLYCGLSMDNRGITGPLLRSSIETVAKAVGSTKDLWLASEPN